MFITLLDAESASDYWVQWKNYVECHERDVLLRLCHSCILRSNFKRLITGRNRRLWNALTIPKA
jgi:hypothetical protein